MRNKVISVRIDEAKYKTFLETVENFTDTLTLEFPSRTEKRYYTKFPDKPYTGRGKYTLSDLINEALTNFIERYKNYNTNQTSEK